MLQVLPVIYIYRLVQRKEQLGAAAAMKAVTAVLLCAAVTATSAGRSFQEVVTEDGTYYTMSLYQARHTFGVYTVRSPPHIFSGTVTRRHHWRYKRLLRLFHRFSSLIYPSSG